MAETLLRRPLVFVAHPDDEALGCALLLQRAEHATVVFATDGAPHDEFFWKASGSRQRLALIRQVEASGAMQTVGISDFHFFDLPDQQLHLHCEPAIAWLSDVVRASKPSAILTHAYEGGHPDHDACSFIAAEAGRLLGLEVWEMPLYHRAGGEFITQKFLTGREDFALDPSDSEWQQKRVMLARYTSQGDFIESFPDRVERFRRQPPYDYSLPPHTGQLNYEAWRWPITGSAVSQALSRTLGNHA
jgi:N-acetylglucosamine malate deacetylase 2